MVVVWAKCDFYSVFLWYVLVHASIPQLVFWDTTVQNHEFGFFGLNSLFWTNLNFSSMARKRKIPVRKHHGIRDPLKQQEQKEKK